MPPDWVLSARITDFVGTFPSFDTMMGILASNYFVPRLAAVIVLCLWFGTRNPLTRQRNQKLIIGAGIGMGLGFFFAEMLCLIQSYTGDFWDRPYENHPQALRAMEQLAFRLPDSSFPSNSVSGLAPVAIILWFADRRASLITGAMVIIWAIGRVYVGIHYPLDIAGGLLIGGISAFLALKIVAALDPLITHLLGYGRKLYLA